jgi:uncharacterized membrane protein YagU involved in acid resistance
MSTSTKDLSQVQATPLTNALRAGAIAGLGGGLVFGIMMGMMGMLPMVGMLIGVENALAGFIVHMVISAILGAGYGFIASRLPGSWGTGIVAGAIYGIVWWVLGALTLMPLMLGMTQMVFAIGGPQWMSLVGHLIFGVITGLLFVPLAHRA